MLKDIQKAIDRVFSSYEVKLQTNNEQFDEPETFTSVLSVEILKEITSTAQTTPKRRKKQEPDPTAASITYKEGDPA